VAILGCHAIHIIYEQTIYDTNAQREREREREIEREIEKEREGERERATGRVLERER
jgi:hypothetical protein